MTGNTVYFSSSSTVGEIQCIQFETVEDTIVEGNETFMFTAVPVNPLDVIDNDTVAITIYDDDGKYHHFMSYRG